MLTKRIFINGMASVSPLGSSEEEVWESYLNPNTCVSAKPLLTADLSHSAQRLVDEVSDENKKYKALDKTVLIGLVAARKAIDFAKWTPHEAVGINMGSSRGATEQFENYHQYFLEQGKSQPFTSPNTTLGNLSSWLANDLKTKGPVFSHSITCSTALHAVLNGVAWITSGMCNRFLVGGTEAPNTPFTVSQMQALKIYSQRLNHTYPCLALDETKTENTMVLGEGAAVFALSDSSEYAIAEILGVGYATESFSHSASISADALCFQDSMKMALSGLDLTQVDVIVTHTPGTIKGDSSEINAIKSVFGTEMPAITTNKWKIGHTLGASGALSLEFAILMMTHQQFISSPFFKNTVEPKHIKKVLINAVGFGGNAVSILVGLVE